MPKNSIGSFNFVYRTDFSCVMLEIFVITYNQENFIGHCLDSLLKYTRGIDAEIVVLNDASTDNTSLVLESYSERCRVIHNVANLGVTGNYNKALSLVTSKYFVIIGGDDWIVGDRFSKQLKILEQNEDCVISGQKLFIGNSAGEITGKRNDRLVGKFGVEALLFNGMITSAASLMYRSSVIKKNDILFDARLPIASDWKHIVDTLMYGGKIHLSADRFTVYRMHGRSVTHEKYQECVNDQLKAMDLITLENNLDSRTIKKMRAYFISYAGFRQSLIDGKLRQAVVFWFRYALVHRFSNLRVWYSLIYFLRHPKSRA